jgi:hypothetical protein
MKQNYGDRMMRARDPRFAKIAERMGYKRRDMVAETAVDETAALRAEYERVIGKRPFMGWDAGKLREKIEAFTKGSE